MAGKASIDSIEKQITMLDDKIEKATTHLNKLKSQRQELIDKRNSIKMQEVAQILQKSNLTPEQAVKILTNYNTENNNN
ncbi:MAG: hypothetical protein IKN43_13500 [Selenomonadaceae bacterium]|nr:hypothetical protein [Selenomonadaceae bacterium]